MKKSALGIVVAAVWASALVGCIGGDEVSGDTVDNQGARDSAGSTRGKFTPPDGQTLLITGQTTDGLRDYKSNFQEPGGVTFYVNPMLQSTGPNFRGTPDWYSSGYGDQNLDFINQTFPNSAVAVGLWMGQAVESDIAYGEDIQKTYLGGIDTGAQMKQNLSVIIDTLKATNRPVFLRLGYEADGEWNGYYPDAYKKDWAYVRQLIQEKGATNIAMVWQVAAWCTSLNGEAPLAAYWPRDASSMYPGLDKPWHDAQVRLREATPAALDDWYPGDDLVDWVAFSYFDQWKTCSAHGKQGLGVLQDAVDYLKSKNKPILVAESSPRGFNLTSGTLFIDGDGYRESGLSGQQIWDEWYKPFFDFVGQNKSQIRAVAYINDDWEAYSHWRCDPNNLSSCAEGYWGDALLSHNGTVANNWRSTVEQSGQFLLGGNGMFDKLNCWGTRGDASSCSAQGGSGGGSSSSGGSGGDSPGAGFTFCADEGGQCSFGGTKIVHYGAGTTWAEKTLTNGTACSNDVFGDPLFGTRKKCFIKDAGGGSAGGGGGGSATAPGTVASGVGAVGDGQTLSYTLQVTSDGYYSFRVSGSAPASQLITTTVDGQSQVNATTGTSGGVIITSPSFKLTAGSHELSFKIQGSGISISGIEAF